MTTRTLTEIEWIDLWESLRRRVTERSARAARMIEEAVAQNWKAVGPRERATIAVAVILDIDAGTPAGRRHARNLLNDFEDAGLLAGEGGVASVREEVQPVSPNIDSDQRQRIATDLRFVMSAAFAKNVESATGPATVLDVVEKSCVSMRGIKASIFLSRIGYPLVVADKPTRRWMGRYGLLDEVKETRANRVEALRVFNDWAHCVGVSLAEMNAVIGIFSGSIRIEEEDAACCVAVPRCPICPVLKSCAYGRFLAKTAGDGPEPVKRNLATAMLPEDRPREKLSRAGAAALTPAELLAILLRTGTEKEHAVELASKILRTAGSLDRLAHMSIAEMTRINGLGEVKAITIKAALELARRLSATEMEHEDSRPIAGSRDVFERMRSHFLNMRKEQFLALLLNAKRRIVRRLIISEGTLNQSLVHPREAFQEAIKDSASAVIFLHNHPSGDPKPSRDDIAITHRLSKTGAIVGIPVLDHIIIGRESYYSFAESQTLEGDG